MEWWKKSVVYQIYPRSFFDTDGDGVGDLRGVTAKLDYLGTLDVDVLWLCPVYQSPNDDNGYDISDYYAIMPEFGSMADFDELLAQAHARGIRIIMDLVVNHTSDEHPWFQAARQSKSSPYRDYYIWRGGKNGAEPNNWGSHFGGSAWKYDELTDEYFLHLFSEKQPDLNWENPALRQEIYRMMHFWLGKGVDGFRMDTINMLSKKPDFPDALGHPGRYSIAEEHFLNGPRLLEYLQEMKREVLSHYDLLTVGEAPGVDPAGAAELTDPERGALNMIFQFDHMRLDTDPTHPKPRWTSVPWSLPELRTILGRWQTELEGRGWNSLYLSNHDVPRMVSRFGHDGEYRVPSAKLLATLLHTLQGTPYIYQGDEIGMTNVQFGQIGDYRDIDALNHYREQVTEQGGDPGETLRQLHVKGRDNARTPMQWTAGTSAGFTTGTPWIGVNPNYPQINVEAALADPESVFWYYRDLIRLRREHPVIVDGHYELLLPDHPTVYAYTRTNADTRLLVLLNFGTDRAALAWPDGFQPGEAELLLGNYPAELDTALNLRPYEARVYLRRLHA